MLSGATLSAAAIAGTAVFRIVVSSDSMKKATATSHGNSRLLDIEGAASSESRRGITRAQLCFPMYHGALTVKIR